MLPKRKRFQNPLDQYSRILAKRWATVVAVFAVTVLITLCHNMSLHPSYRTEAKLLIDAGAPRGGDELAKYGYDVDYFLTQFEVLTSTPILTRVVEKLGLTESYRSAPTSLETLRARLSGQPINVQQGADLATVLGQLQRSVRIDPQTKAGLMRVTVEGSDPQQIRDICNTLVDTFIDEGVSARMKSRFATTEYLSHQLDKLNRRIQAAEKELEEFQKREGIQGISDKATLDTQQFSQYVEKYMSTREQVWELETRLGVLNQIVTRDDFEGLTLANLRNETLDSLSQQLFQAETALSLLEKQDYKEKHPLLVEARASVEFLRKQIVHETRRYIAGLESELAVLKQRESSLRGVWQQYQTTVSGTFKERSEWEYLKRDLDLHRSLFESYDQQLKKVQLVDEVSSINIRVIEPAVAPRTPFAPNKRANLLLGMLVGLFLGLFLAFFREFMDNSIRSIEDVSDYLEIPVLGTIPVMVDSRPGAPVLQLKAAPGSLVSESYRSLRTNLRFLESERPFKSLLVTSSGPAEGKSTTVANLALTLAQAGKRVCLVDTDLRRPVLHKYFNRSNEFGLTSIFSGVTDKKRLLVSVGFEKLYLLPSGPIPPNPAELLGSPRMVEAAASLGRDFDYVLFDSPPVLLVTDALVLSSVVDGVLLVIRAGDATITSGQHAVDALQSIKANIVGAVLNRFDFKHSNYHYHYSKYYRYGYGYGSDASSQRKTSTSGQRTPSTSGQRTPSTSVEQKPSTSRA